VNNRYMFQKNLAKITDLPTPMLSETIDRAIFLREVRTVAADSDHPHHTYVHVLPSGRRYRCMKWKRVWNSRSFVLAVITMLNQ